MGSLSSRRSQFSMLAIVTAPLLAIRCSAATPLCAELQGSESVSQLLDQPLLKQEMPEPREHRG